MQYAIELFFDKETEESLFELAKKVADANLSTKYLEWKTRPHVTLACFNDVDEEKCIERLKEFAISHSAVPANMDSVGMFNDTKVVFISPTMNRAMFKFHEELHECMKEFDTKGWHWYCPDDWVPHCAMVLAGEDEDEAFYKASDLVLREYKKLFGQFTRVGLVKITFPVEEIFTVDLGEIKE